jgi:acyl-CoA synthetase (AMP-forming)/AMP-acid ligase II
MTDIKSRYGYIPPDFNPSIFFARKYLQGKGKMRYLIQHFIDESFRLRRDYPAVKQGQQTYTYGQLDELATQFSQHYCAQGLGKGSLVGIVSQVRVETIAAMIGALRSGIVYVPLNIHAPTAWLNGVIRRAGIKTLLVDLVI